MRLTRIFLVIAALGVAMLACTFTINDQIQSVSVGDLKTREIDIPAPDADQVLQIEFEFGAGEINIQPGEGASAVSGTATFNVEEFEPQVSVAGTTVNISQQVEDINLLPVFGDDLENRWDFELGNSPMELDISAGGYQGSFELGGIPIHELRVAEGAARTDLSFSEPNPVEMDTLRYDTGASQAVLSGLANANFRTMDFRSGAGDYRLDFAGELQQDADVTIKSGLSSVVIVVPEGTSATVRFDSSLANIETSGGWQLTGDVYSLPGAGPELTITIELGAGNLELRTK